MFMSKVTEVAVETLEVVGAVARGTGNLAKAYEHTAGALLDTAILARVAITAQMSEEQRKAVLNNQQSSEFMEMFK